MTGHDNLHMYVGLFVWYIRKPRWPGLKSRGHQADSTGRDLGGIFLICKIMLLVSLETSCSAASLLETAGLAPLAALSAVSLSLLVVESSKTTHPTYRIVILSLLHLALQHSPYHHGLL